MYSERKATGTVRLACKADGHKLLEIYRPYVENTAISFECEVPSEEEFCTRIENTLIRYPYLVYESSDGELLGYAYASAFKSRAAYDWAVETSIYIRNDCRGAGIGRLLYARLEEILKRQNVLNVNACIASPRPDNTRLEDASLRFHTALGYTMVGTFHRCGFKFNEWYDMCWMEKMLGEHTVPARPFIPFSQLQEKIVHE